MARSALGFAALGAIILGAACMPKAHAQAVLDGDLMASRDCPAVLSIKRGTNPDEAKLETGKRYAIVGQNRADGSHYRVVLPGLKRPERWVEKACGLRMGGTIAEGGIGAPPTAGAARPPRPGRPAGDPAPRTWYVLAASWQPAFCEGRREKPECASQTPERADATRFSLHGLWPQPRRNEYCGVPESLKATDDAGRWADLPPVEIDAGLADRLKAVMPGVASSLDRHEWTRHGTCYGKGATAYFTDSIVLMEQLNGSKVAALFAQRIGREVTRAEIRAAFDESFGAGAGERVRIACRQDGKRRLIGEITLGLAGTIVTSPDLGALMRAAKPTDGGCEGGIVDPAGQQ
ncbi:ribonuclease [Aurantimonas sp. Leaf443]|uniref:ribonuclease T2 family protein n=1 Tax=Aurantimonas sp. Leaf443 TaxID=1736378 RepID=UPI000AD6E678|nr:ribonuclease [Aurantimonas sp. Leaf443]